MVSLEKRVARLERLLLGARSECEENASKLDYIALMTDVDLPSDETEGETDGE